MNGIQITNGTDIKRTPRSEFVVDSHVFGGMKLYKIFTFKFGGDRIKMSNSSNLFAYIQYRNHGLDYVPAYLAYKIYGADITQPEFISVPYNNFISVGGDSDFVNVDSQKITVGFDEVIRADFLQVIVFAEKLADS